MWNTILTIRFLRFYSIWFSLSLTTCDVLFFSLVLVWRNYYLSWNTQDFASHSRCMVDILIMFLKFFISTFFSIILSFIYILLVDLWMSSSIIVMVLSVFIIFFRFVSMVFVFLKTTWRLHSYFLRTAWILN